MELTISTIGIIVLIVLVTLGIIVFLIMGVGAQTDVFNQTHTNIIGNLSGLLD